MEGLEIISTKLCGIYCIENKTNNKKYVGKAIDIRRRILAHIRCLDKDCLDENRHFKYAWFKYGIESFKIYILEICSYEDLPKKELYWMQTLNTLDNKLGYNKRLDSSGGMIAHEDTRKITSENGIRRFKNNPELRLKMAKQSSEFWKNNPDIKDTMSKKVSDATTKYKIYQYDKEGNLLKEYRSVKEVTTLNPGYYDKHIYNAMSSHITNKSKQYAYGFKWIKVLKDSI
jgi:group I intron endonuclease